MSSSPYKKYHTSEIIKDHLQKLKSIRDNGLIQAHELAQIHKLERELIEIEKAEKLKPISNFPKAKI